MYTILIVDDEEPSIEGIICGVNWKSLGINTVVSAVNARQAREQFERQHIDLLLCDIEMPQENGISLLRWARQHSPDTVCILLTCHADFKYAQEALMLGAFDYLLKPAPYIDIETTLLKAIDKTMQEKKKQDYMQYRQYWERNKNVVEEQFWQDVVTGGVATNKRAILKQAQKRGLEICPDANYHLILCSIRQYPSAWEEWNAADFDYACRNILCELFSQPIVISIDSYRKVVILSSEHVQYTEAQLEQRCREYIKAQQIYLDSNVCIYCALPVPVSGLAECYLSLLQMNRDNATFDSKVFLAKSVLPTASGFVMDKVEPKRISQVIIDVNQYIEEHLSDEIAREDLAALVHLNPSYLSRLYRKETKLSISEYLVAVRLEKIKEYLRTTDLSVSAIAYKVGYNNLPYMIKMFKKETGVTPLEYRKNNF